MKKEQKNEIIEQISEEFKANRNFYLTDVSTLTVNETNELRKLCHKFGITLHIAKNTFIKIALERADISDNDLFDTLKGPSSIMFSDNINAPAKLIKEFRKNYKKPVLKAAYIEQTVYIGDKRLESLINLKTREELIADLVSMLVSPLRNLIGALNNSGGNIMGILKTISDKKEENS